MEPLFAYDGPLEYGTYLERPNRFTILVELEGREERVYLRNTGGMGTVLEAGREVCYRPVDDPTRVTDADAVAVRVGDRWVTVDSTLPNRVFEECVDRGLLPRFDGYEVVAREPPLPSGGRTDFLLEGPTGADAYVEVKSNTYVEDGISKFPDRQTERGRRQVRELQELAEEGVEAHVGFVIQRPDASRLRPFRSVDPAFADRLVNAAAAGVEVWALATAFRPPEVYLHEPAVPVDLE